MEYRQLGESGLSLSAITFGAWAIGKQDLGGIEPQDAIEALRKAYELGFTSIDTAPLYGLGLSEEVVAAALAGIPRDKVQILTKCGVVWEGDKGQLWYAGIQDYGRPLDFYRYSGKESIIQQCEDSLRRLKTDYIDLYSIHWPDSTTPIEESAEALNLLIKQGKIRAAGVCNHPMALMKKAEDTMCVASNKIRYSMLNRAIEKDLIPYCQEKKKGVLAYSVLQRGILTGKDVRPFIWEKDDTRPEVALYEPENMKRIKSFLDKLTLIAMDNGATLPQLCIHWTINRCGAIIALLGATSAGQVADDAKAMDIRLGEADLNAIDALLSDLENDLLLV